MAELTPGLTQRGRVNAVAARRRRADVKRQLADGELAGEEFWHLARAEPAIARLTVRQVCASLWSVGPTKVQAWCAEHRLDHSRRVGSLGSAHRRALSEFIDAKRKR